jgi:hypothetical protein
VDVWRNGLRVKTSRWLWTWLDLQERDRHESEVGQQMATILVNLAAAQSDIGSPIPLQIALAFRRNDLDPKNPSLLSTDFPIFVTIRDVEFIDPTVRRRHAVQRSHGSSSLFGSRQINEAVTLSHGWDLGIAVYKQHSLADGLQVETLEQVLHLSIDNGLPSSFGLVQCSRASFHSYLSKMEGLAVDGLKSNVFHSPFCIRVLVRWASLRSRLLVSYLILIGRPRMVCSWGFWITASALSVLARSTKQ